MEMTKTAIKEAVLQILDELPAEQATEIWDFARFIRVQTQDRIPSDLSATSVPAAHLDSLVGLVAWGGDALADAERLYEL
jgi:hypothetical protein